MSEVLRRALHRTGTTAPSSLEKQCFGSYWFHFYGGFYLVPMFHVMPVLSDESILGDNMSFKLKTPRIYWVRFVEGNRYRIFCKMLGVAFTNTDRQGFYNIFKNYEHWSRWTGSIVTLESEEVCLRKR